VALKKATALIFTLLLTLVLCQPCIQSTRATLSTGLTTSSPENVIIFFLDVGQGDSILVKTPSKNVLIDGGPTSAGSAVVNDLNAYQVSKIDLMVATHPHADHIGGLISVLQSSIPVQDIVYNGFNYTSTQTFNTWKTLALTRNLTQGLRNQVYVMSPTINFTILSPTSPTQFGSTTDDLNSNSIVIKFQVGNTSVLLSGDAQFDTEQFLLSSGSNLHNQILKVGHHGSSTSTSIAFLNAVNPSYAVISAGVDNPYGHPSRQTLDRLSSNNVITYGTYSYGTIIFSLNSASQVTTPTPTPASTLSPTSAPSQNPTSMPTPSNISTANPSSTPNIPEFPSTIFIITFLITATLLGTVVIKIKQSRRM
jgi:competence protein ComEC